MDTTFVLVVKALLILGFLTIAVVWAGKMTYTPGQLWEYFTRRKLLPPSLIFTMLLGVQIRYIAAPLTTHTSLTTISIVGLTLYFLGLGLAIWGRLSMGDYWGLPAQHDATRQKELVIKGAFRHSRNPIYTGLNIAFLGFELALQSWLFLLVIPAFIYTMRVVHKEEKLLHRHFEEKWVAYSKKVKRFL